MMEAVSVTAAGIYLKVRQEWIRKGEIGETERERDGHEKEDLAERVGARHQFHV